jgi:hypothetical protein
VGGPVRGEGSWAMVAVGGWCNTPYYKNPNQVT